MKESKIKSGKMFEVGFCTINVKAYRELRLEIVGILTLMANLIRTFEKYDLGDDNGKVWVLIREEAIINLIEDNINPKTLRKYIRYLVDNDYLDLQKIGYKEKYFKLTTKGEDLTTPKKQKNNSGKVTVEKKEIKPTPKIAINKEIETLGECPLCDGDLIKRSGKNGDFLGCSNFPKCKHNQALVKGMKNATPKPKITNEEREIIKVKESEEMQKYCKEKGIDWNSLDEDTQYELKYKKENEEYEQAVKEIGYPSSQNI